MSRVAPIQMFCVALTSGSRDGGRCKRRSVRAPDIVGFCRARIALARAGEQDLEGSSWILQYP
eukprot:6763569-Pyramimonas_sp.AAC.1